MPPLFGDHMVLQQGSSLPIWGTADPGEEVTIDFVGQKAITKAEDNGHWRVNLKPVYLRSAPDVLRVNGKNHLEFSDVLLGDVWLCSGQSNMAFPLSKSENADEELVRAHDTQLRFFVVKEKTALHPEEVLEGEWQLCMPETAAKFSAVGYFFGRDLRQRTRMPIGLIGSYANGSPIQSWMSLKALKEAPSFSGYLAEYAKFLAELPEAIATFSQRKEAYDKAIIEWKNKIEIPYQEELAIWKNQCDEARLKLQAQPLKPQPKMPEPELPKLPGGGVDVPSLVFNGMIAPLIPYAITGVIWYQGEANEGAEAALHYRRLFQRLIRSWRQAWGQGPFPFYFVSLPSYYKSSAQAVEPMFNEPEEPNPSWAWLRESQSTALSLPQTGMIVATDIGDPVNIHPANKLDIGRRLALLARKNVYGEDLVASGPIYRSMKIQGNKITLTFDSQGNGLTIAAPRWSYNGNIPFAVELNGFAIADSERHWMPAIARIEGDHIIVYSEFMEHPQAVRYNWANNPSGNLYNKNGLPAASFRTDIDQPK